jgi:DNA-binding transcriptional LysR family regulator
MEMRHLRYFVVVAEALSFTKASAKLRVAQPALSRQMRDLEDEIGVDLLKRSPRGLALTAEGKLYLAEAKEILNRSNEAVVKVRALAKGDYGELHVGYSPSPTAEILPPALTAFQKATPGVRVVLHDLAGDEMTEGVLDGTLHLAVMVERFGGMPNGLTFEELRRYRFCVAMAPDHPLATKKTIAVAELAGVPLVAFRRKDYTGYYELLDKIFSPHGIKPKIGIECDGASSLITDVEVGRGIAVVNEIFNQLSGKRLAYRPFSDSDVSHGVGIASSVKGDVTPAGEKFCEVLRNFAKGHAKLEKSAKTKG